VDKLLDTCDIGGLGVESVRTILVVYELAIELTGGDVTVGNDDAWLWERSVLGSKLESSRPGPGDNELLLSGGEAGVERLLKSGS